MSYNKKHEYRYEQCFKNKWKYPSRWNFKSMFGIVWYNNWFKWKTGRCSHPHVFAAYQVRLVVDSKEPLCSWPITCNCADLTTQIFSKSCLYNNSCNSQNVFCILLPTSNKLKRSLPFCLLVGNHSSGKSSFINYILQRDIQKAGVAPWVFNPSAEMRSNYLVYVNTFVCNTLNFLKYRDYFDYSILSDK